MARFARVGAGQWGVVAWLWQAFRNDMAQVVSQSYPSPDGRYSTTPIDGYPGPDREGWLAWTPHPRLGDDVPVGFALITGIGTPEQALAHFFVVPAARRTGLGRAFAAHVLAQHPAPWTVAFQHDNTGAGVFWRRVWTEAYGAAWAETEEPVPGKPEVPPDHWLRTT